MDTLLEQMRGERYPGDYCDRHRQRYSPSSDGRFASQCRLFYALCAARLGASAQLIHTTANMIRRRARNSILFMS